MSFFEEHIDDYILEKLDESTKEKFDQLLIDNPDLQKKLDQHRELVYAIKSFDFKQKVDAFVQEKKTKTNQNTGRVINLKMLTAIAASLLLLAVAVNQMFFSKSSNEAEQLFFTDPGLPTPMSEVESYDFYDAMVDYKAEKYGLALTKWTNLKNTIGVDTLQFYQAMANYNLEKFEQASSLLSQIKPNSSFYNKSQWYLIGTYIETGQIEQAKRLFIQLDSSKYDQYDQLKKRLEK